MIISEVTLENLAEQYASANRKCHGSAKQGFIDGAKEMAKIYTEYIINHQPRTVTPLQPYVGKFWEGSSLDLDEFKRRIEGLDLRGFDGKEAFDGND